MGEEYVVTLRYSEALARRAVTVFMWRALGRGYAVALGLVGMSLALVCWAGRPGWTAVALGAVLGLGLLVPGLAWAVRDRQARAKCRALAAGGSGPTATLRATLQAVTFTSCLGELSLPWANLREVWRFPEFWLLLIARNQYVTLPREGLPAGLEGFIRDRVEVAGGRVV